ncbi:MAG: symporter [Alicyclobacillus sp. RIFOXYA1_FULL_53_8]|nr:MAG: symporter [Alicyclobacillus sp. RIFOXYA1_FULL_53_8]
MTAIDQVHLNFNHTTLTIMNVVIGFIMFGVALDLKGEDFKRMFSSPKPILLGLVVQFIIMPAFTFLLILIINPLPSIALGMILIAACPGGNLSNFLTYLAKGNTALSITMSASSTVLAIFMTPLNMVFWGSLNPRTHDLLRSFTISPWQMLTTILFLLGLPLVVGMYVGHKYPNWSQKMNKYMKYASIVFFLLFVLTSLAANFQAFLRYIGMVFFAVLLHNIVAIVTAYFTARSFKLPEQDRRAISIEVGIQNSGLGLILIFNFFGGLGGMAIVAAWWSVWHIIAGLSLATFWSKRPARQPQISQVST